MNFFFKIMFLFIVGVSLHSQDLTITKSDSLGEFSDAAAVAVDQFRGVYITDLGSNTIYKYDDNGKLIASLGGYGWDNNSLDTPIDAAVSFDLNIYVCDYNNHRLQRYDRNLNYISSVLSKSNPDKRVNFGYPKSIAFSKEGEIFFIDSENIRIVQLDAFRNFVRDFGGINSGDGKLFNPSKIRIYDNILYAVDNNRIIAYDLFGNYIKSIYNADPVNGIAFLNEKIVILEKDSLRITNQKTTSTISIPLSGILNDKQNDNLIPKEIFINNDQLYLLCNHKLYIFHTTYQ